MGKAAKCPDSKPHKRTLINQRQVVMFMFFHWCKCNRLYVYDKKERK